jgi:hypothetical protein
MYNELNAHNTPRAHGANEINLQVRETEKNLALIHTFSREGFKSGGENVLQRAAHRIATVMASLF